MGLAVPGAPGSWQRENKVGFCCFTETIKYYARTKCIIVINLFSGFYLSFYRVTNSGPKQIMMGTSLSKE